MKGMTAPMKNITWCNLPNKSKLHIVQLHVVQKYMDIAIIGFFLKQRNSLGFSKLKNSPILGRSRASISIYSWGS